MSDVVASSVGGTTAIAVTDSEDTPLLLGWSIREVDTPSGVVVANIHAGTSAAGQRVGTIQMTTGGESQVWRWPGIRCPGGIYVNLVAGGIFGVVYWRGVETS
jgi:hypothetical protein